MSTATMDEKLERILREVTEKKVHGVSIAEMALLTSGTMQRLQRIDTDLYSMASKLDDALGMLGEIKTRLGMFEPPVEHPAA